MELKLNFEGFEGHVTMKVANNIDRLELMDKLNINISDLSKNKEDVSSLFQKTAIFVKLLKISKKFYEEISLKNGEKSYKNFDDLNDDPACQAIMMECATKALMGLGAEQEK